MVAPAGCGKTQLITDALAALGATRPVLVLTHTNAGVAALRGRLGLAGVPARAYRIMTLDGWAMRLASNFPARSGLPLGTLELRDTERDYSAIRDSAVRMLAEGHLVDLLRTTYDRIVVDEYQDCNTTQHSLVRHAATAVPTVVLGDPLQAIFGFGGNQLPDWETVVCGDFPIASTLNTPWRWKNVGAHDLGEWLLDIRAPLGANQPVDLESAPGEVQWVHLTGHVGQDRQLQIRAGYARVPGGHATALVIADSDNSSQQRKFASQIAGAVTVESVDLKDLIDFAEALDKAADGRSVVELVVDFAGNTMTNVGVSAFMARIRSLLGGTARKEPSEAESAARRLHDTPSPNLIADLLEELRRQRDVRIYRPAVIHACFAMLRACRNTPTLGYREAARRIREEVRAGNHRVAARAVGSTLLMKGLEADLAVVLNPVKMDAKHLYVAMTRGAKRLVVCSHSSKLVPNVGRPEQAEPGRRRRRSAG
ncbi:UvrD-helicase domain-containing protein [Gemmatimonas sp.]|uniref:UvrD-helicase domain-containing protein n=1 Tax=Gemmatimonas sp. TaxID=1962908 RepID=UPI0025C63A42|nr:UvrD-helicase domain-containing protein [Gemmatimonas sp.]